ncbi:MAG TPA: hypothetical protein PKX79_12050 [Spirochaetota bacterium]|nr:hypothetical protein [Spirochaetota bacterium]
MLNYGSIFFILFAGGLGILLSIGQILTIQKRLKIYKGSRHPSVLWKAAVTLLK